MHQSIGCSGAATARDRNYHQSLGCETWELPWWQQMWSRVEIDEIRGRTGVKSIQSGRKGNDWWVGLDGSWWSQERNQSNPVVLFSRYSTTLLRAGGIAAAAEAKSQEQRLWIPSDMVDSRIRGYPPSRWRLWEVFGSNLACLTLGLIAAFYRQGA